MLCNSLSVSPPFLSLKSSRNREKAAMPRQICCATQPIGGGGTKRHFVLVHGAGHGAWCWYKVSSLLKSAGHNVTALDMAASGVNPKNVEEINSYSEYYEPLMEFMGSLPPEERVVLVGHSMNGICIADAMENFPQKISVGVFAGALMPGPEFSFKEIGKKYSERSTSTPADNDIQYLFGNGPDNPPTAILHGLNYLAAKLYNLSPPEDLVLATMLIRPVPLCYGEPVLTKEKYGSVHRVFIICDEGNDGIQRWMIENNPVDEVMVISGSDHMAMFSKPQELSSCLQKIGEKYL